MTHPQYPHQSQPDQPVVQSQAPSPGWRPGPFAPQGTQAWLPPQALSRNPNTLQVFMQRLLGWGKKNPLIAVIAGATVVLFGCCGVTALAVSDDSSGGSTPGVYYSYQYGDDEQQGDGGGGGQVDCISLNSRLDSLEDSNESLREQIESGNLSPAMEGIYQDTLSDGEDLYDELYSQYLQYC